MNKTVEQKLSALRAEMKKREISCYVIFSADFHGSEYVGDYFKERAYMSGFTGSAGTLVVEMNEARLWTDGRYFLQASEQLAETEIILMKDGTDGVPKLTEYLAKKLNENDKLGFDGRTVSCQFIKQLEKELNGKQLIYCGKEDLVSLFWENRPALPHSEVWELSECYAGVSRKEKLERLKSYLKEQNLDTLLITSLEEICWLLNLRGNDVESTPVFLGYILANREQVVLYWLERELPESLTKALAADGVVQKGYFDIYQDVEQLPDGSRLQLDEASANFLFLNCLKASYQVTKKTSPVELWKAIKNPVECENIKLAHRKDGAAVVQFIHWLKESVKAGEQVTELSAAEQLETFRAMKEHFVEQSFSPIIAYGAHGAIVHYSPTEESNVVMEKRGLCLADTGGHYLEGTTDITRTIALGELSAEEKKMFTLVLKGHLALSKAYFKDGCIGANLDYLAREPMWKEGLDYLHGTGHGVGYLLSVHEGPHRIHYGVRNVTEATPLKPGMIVSNEPGFYEAGKFGIRHENLVLVKEYKKTEYGTFYCFENLTMVPFDKDAIEVSLLTEEERAQLNSYHAMVFDSIKDFLEEKEVLWLQEMTAPI